MPNKTIFITGASSGIGLLTAKYFHQLGWNVVASARSLNKISDWAEDNRLLKVYADVVDPQSVELAIAKAIEKFGKIDVFVNNAGLGNFGLFEDMSDDQINNLIEVNIKGVITSTKLILPHFRDNKGGVIINLSSLVGKVPTPLMSLYSATKFAVEGFFEALKVELALFNIKVRIIEPGPYNTGFGDAALISNSSSDENIISIRSEINTFIKNMIEKAKPGYASEVVKTIYKSAISPNNKLRYAVGFNANFLMFIYRLIPNGIWTGIMSAIIKLKFRKK